MKTLLVTGGAGFIGANFVRHVLAGGFHRVVTFDTLTYAGNKDNLKGLSKRQGHTFVKGDIVDFKRVDGAVKEHGVDTIVHFAAESHVDRSIEHPVVFVKTNILGTQTLLDVARKHDLRFHHISTDEVFGDLREDDPPFDEMTRYDPHSPYSASKAASDHLVRAYRHTYGLRSTISNCSNNYGPYQHPEKLIPLFITNLIDGLEVPVYGTGQNRRDWLHVMDHCRALMAILEKGRVGETYCVGGGHECTNLELTRRILSEMRKDEGLVRFVKDRPGHDLRYAIDSSKIQRELGWRPEIDFGSGIRETIRWYRDNEWWWRPLKGGRA
jgi:dTDP-glucose 4,6-dehydratase